MSAKRGLGRRLQARSARASLGAAALLLCGSPALGAKPRKAKPVAPAPEPPPPAPEREPEPEPEPAPAPPQPPAEAPPAPPAEPAAELLPSPLEVRVGGRVSGRSFHYVDTLAQVYPEGDYPVLRSYNLPAGPVPFIQATWYPAAHLTASWLAHLGLRGGYEMLVGSKLADPVAQVSYDQQNILWYAGLRGRIPIDLEDDGHGELGLLTTFANHSASVVGLDDVIPDVDYKMLELGAEGEWRLNGLILGGYASYLLVLDSGAVAGPDWFLHSKSNGMHFGGNVGWELSRVIDILAGVDVRAYALDFNPVSPSRPPEQVAGGATDRTLSAWAALAFHIPADQAPPPSEPSPSEPSPSDSATTETKTDDFGSFD